MKKFISFMLYIVMMVILTCSCGKVAIDDSKLNIVCTVFPQYDFVKNIVGDTAEVTMLVPLGIESHDFNFENITAVNMKKVAKADMVIYIGGKSDGEWIEKLQENINNDKAIWLSMSDMVEKLVEQNSDSMVHEHDESQKHESVYDEHVWTSPLRAKQIVQVLCNKLCELGADKSGFYQTNTEKYLNQLEQLNLKLKSTVDNRKRDILVFADRFPFRYLCEDYGLRYDAAFEGCSANADPSVLQITSLCDKAIDFGVKSIFYMENSNPVYARQIAERVGGKAVLLHSCHTLSAEEINRGENYISIMNNNIEKIAEALA